MNPNISIVIPTYNCRENLKELMDSLTHQLLKPSEVLVVDSSSDDAIQEYVNSLNTEFPVTFIRSAKNYPGEKRNEGAEAASSEWLAFLDVGTIPRQYWLQTNWNLAQEYGLDIIFGSTQYQALNQFQMLLRAATYGNVAHETTPGTLVKTQIFIQSGGFIEGIRAGDDQEWRLQLRDISKKYKIPDVITLDYSNLPNSIIPMQKKYFIYYLHGAKVRAQRRVRDIYLSALLVFASLIVVKWNYLIGGWDSNPFFIPNITKIYLLSLMILLLTYIIVRSLFKSADQFNIFHWFSKLFLFLIALFTVYFWNFYVADWQVDSLYFIPHITKIYIASVLIASFLYRGIFLPLRLGITSKFLFPKNWMIIGFIGLTLDVIKFPGILLGILLSPFQRNLSNSEKN
jgi:glycosyltransferase involved in cell wall biosynthesis